MNDDGNDLRLCLQLAAVALLLTLPAVVLPTWPGSDTSAMYTPMMREFAVGNWAGAFYPMIPPVFPLAGGLLAAMGIPCQTAAKLAASLFFVAAVFPLFYLQRLVWGRQTAVVAVWLFILCPRLLRYAGSGLPDSGKIFFLILTVYGVFKFAREPRWCAMGAVAVGTVGLALVRGEGVAYSLIALAAMAVVSLRYREPLIRRRALGRTALAVIVFAAGISPWLAYEYRATGFPVTDKRQIHFVRPLMKGRAVTMPADPAVSLASPDLGRRIGDGQPPSLLQRLWDRLVIELFKGFFPPYLVLILPALIWRWRRRLDKRQHWLLLGCAVLHTAVLVAALGGTWVQKRYVIAALPLLLGWAATGWIALTAEIQNRWSVGPRLVPAMVLIVAAVLVWDGTKKVRPESKAHKQEWRQVVTEAAAWLRSDGRQLLPEGKTGLSSTLLCYHSGRPPVVLTSVPQFTLLAEADLVQPGRYRYQRTFSPEELFELCRLKQIDFVVVDRRFRQHVSAPGDLDSFVGSLVPRYTASVEHSENELVIYQYHPVPEPADGM